jgi:Fe-Mn family superoxide dismutase
LAYEARNYEHLIGMPGFSEQLLRNHFTLYQGYVTNTNKLLELTGQMAKEGKPGTPEYSELKRRMGFEWDGMRLHEYYFDNLGGAAPRVGRRRFERVAVEFGSLRRGRSIAASGRCAASVGPPSISIPRAAV